MRRETVETVQLVFQPLQNRESSYNHKSKSCKGNKLHQNQQNKNFGGQISSGLKRIMKKNDQFFFIRYAFEFLVAKLWSKSSEVALRVWFFSYFGRYSFCTLFYDYRLIGNDLLCDDLYKLSSAPFGEFSYFTNVSKKRALICESSFMLWHKLLGHISRDRMKGLVKVEILPPLDFSDFDTCVDSIRRKPTKSTRKCSTRSDGVLDLIHTNISRRLPSTICGNKYFTTFIDDFSRYGCVYLINNKSHALEKFKIFKLEVDKQCGKNIKVVRFDRGGDYYEKYDEFGQNMSDFAKFLQECGIIPQ
ncbi:uncharacterized protein LOC111406867 [Olea europaea var. sylvestris]|uniref:uncharacterized protein LOC111406867 n=1 Tax=Olea europaea var. sylvestris TaxID=158386 RepID=UPI000C1D17AA|nr:uncharacterized protein LOC111406867 [Olea europaea var. sylvestris]